MGRKNSDAFVPLWQKAGMRVLVPWWYKVWMGALCHDGRRYEWEPCATVAESESGSLVPRWQKVKSRSLYAMMAESMSRVPCVTVA